MDDDVAAEIKNLEARRVQALLANDAEKLSALMAEDLVHVHATGRVENKAEYMEGVRTRLEFLKIERSELQIRMFGDVAVATGPLNQEVRLRNSGNLVDLKAVATQVWVKRAGGWVQSSFQATRVES